MIWNKATKIGGLRAKPMCNLVIDDNIISKFLVDTLEGREPITSDSIFCMGDSGDVWQQSSNSLLKKYNIVDIVNGWLVCKPKSDNLVEFYESQTEQLITGKWGETIDGVKNQQRCKIGDFVLRKPDKHDDMWVVQRLIFLNTYLIVDITK